MWQVLARTKSLPLSARQWGPRRRHDAATGTPRVCHGAASTDGGQGSGSIHAGIPLSSPTTEVVGFGERSHVNHSHAHNHIMHSNHPSPLPTLLTRPRRSFPPSLPHRALPARSERGNPTWTAATDGPKDQLIVINSYHHHRSPPPSYLGSKPHHNHHHQLLLLSVVRIPL